MICNNRAQYARMHAHTCMRTCADAHGYACACAHLCIARTAFADGSDTQSRTCLYTSPHTDVYTHGYPQKALDEITATRPIYRP